MLGLKTAILYSLKPHELGYCGPLCVKDSKNILKRYLLGEKFEIKKITNLLDDFIGARSYYGLIAKKNGIKNIYDDRVVKAYWIGNELLNNITLGDLEKMIFEKFVNPKNLTLEKAKKIIKKIPPEINAHHSFHVFFVSGVANNIVKKRKDDCKTSWGKIIKIYNKEEKLKIKTKRLFPDKKETIINIDWNKQFIPHVEIGNFVSFHWGRVSGVLTEKDYNNLIKYTYKNYEAYQKAYSKK